MLQTNIKKPIHLKNRTKYFNPATSRSHVTFSSPDSYQSREMKIEGYETRLYWQFKYCEDHNGQTFFYTLTYNDKALPKHYGINCFDYEDLRDLLTGGFRKQLLRKYGSTFKYFIGAELGDGKGERGMHNNPHYHALFFVEPANNERFPYVKISPTEFRHLIRLYWQGFDEDVTGYQDYNEAKYGIAKEGSENLGLVTDFRACNYVSKYVCKDAALKANEDKVIRRLKLHFKKELKNNSSEVDEAFFRETVYSLYNIPLNPKRTQWCYTDAELIERLLPNAFDSQRELFMDVDPLGPISIYMADICRKYHLWKDYWKTFNAKVDEKVQAGLTEYRNRYCNKCRISHGVGDYALEFCDVNDPSIKVPSKKGFKNRPLSMYYYRKLYTDVIMDKMKSPIRIINEDGINYKVNRLPDQIKKMSDKAFNNLMLVIGNEDLFNKMRASDVNTDVWYDFSSFLDRVKELTSHDNLENIVKRYAEYKLIYEDRFFPYQSNGSGTVIGFPTIDITGDYRRFLVPSIFSVSRSDYRLDAFLENDCKGYMAYREHPYFLRYIGLFTVLDLCTDYFFIQKDNQKQKDAEERARVKRFHNQSRLKDFYSRFKN